MDQLQPEHHFPYVIHVLKFLNCVDFAQELTQLLEDVQGVGGLDGQGAGLAQTELYQR